MLCASVDFSLNTYDSLLGEPLLRLFSCGSFSGEMGGVATAP